MNTNDRSVFKLLHSPADFAPEGRGHDVAAALERAPGSFECELPMRLELNITSADGGPVTLGMTPCDSFEADGRRFEIYSAHIPAAVMKKGTLGYTIEGGGCRGEYCGHGVAADAAAYHHRNFQSPQGQKRHLVS